MGMIRFDNGALLQIEFSEPQCQDRNALCRAPRTQVSAWRDGQVEISRSRMASSSTCARPGRWPTMAMPATSSISSTRLGKAEPCYQPQQGVDMIRILTAIYESARTGAEVRL